MKEKQKGIDTLNVFVICITIMVIVTAIINGTIKASAYTHLDNTPWENGQFTLRNNDNNFQIRYAFEMFDNSPNMNYAQFAIQDNNNVWIWSIASNDGFETYNTSKFGKLMVSNGNDPFVQLSSYTLPIQHNGYTVTAGMVYYSLQDALNSIRAWYASGGHEPDEIEDNEIPAPQCYWYYNEDNTFLPDYNHYDTTLVYQNYENQYYVGVFARMHYPTNITEHTISGTLQKYVTLNEEEVTNWYTIASPDDVSEYHHGYIPSNNMLDFTQTETNLGENNNLNILKAIRIDKAEELRLNKGNSIIRNLCISKIKQGNGGWVGYDVLTYYYYIADNGDIHFGPTSQYTLSLASAVRFTAMGTIKTMEGQIITSTTDVTQSEIRDTIETGDLTENETTEVGQEYNGILVGDIDTGNIELGISNIKGIGNSLIDFIGDVPIMFGKIFTFLPEWLLKLIYFALSLSVIYGIIKIIRG